ncbi:uncharacterized protein Z519_10708 [Cladophialophora bantiana CBS 173.52]|uniref:Uncharacterized protein n=1 Tax=Cladophialophora bantiana (strain ATCC 10958 / CBS 173.52 / CDC B-1940 / NIH 8579) TaxID=1442370 RepID=A0A0D2FPW6_CLAB1|nr:uncharacterized protein Z519_10708 [Cladophialophora bantiana CBS 173.52]KIW88662.1 hypothetical protein Z519_10708 [Cladophialophora bantiana CBS 173.52]
MIDDSLPGAKVHHAPPPEEAWCNNKDITLLPEEITSRVIGCVVGDGLRVSNGARYDVNLETIRSLLKTSVSIRRETLRQVFRRPLRFCLSGEKTCDCEPLLESIGHKECRCTLLLDKIVRLPLSKWTALVVHFVPLVPAVAAQEVDVDVDGADDLQGDDQQRPEKQTSRQTAVDDSGWALRGEFLAVVQRVKHYSRSLSTTLYFLLKQRANLSCDAACCGVIEMSRRRHYGPVYCSYDPKFPALPFDVSFVFESPPVDVLSGGGEDRTLMPLWTMNMVNGLLMPWWRFITKRGVSQQIKLPSSIAAAFTMGRDRISQEFPHRPTAVAERLQRDFADFWAIKPGLIPSYDAASLWPCVVNFDGSFEWYMNPAPLKQAPTRWTIRGVPVIRIVVPEPDTAEQGDGDDDSSARWRGEFLASDG